MRQRAIWILVASVASACVSAPPGPAPDAVEVAVLDHFRTGWSRDGERPYTPLAVMGVRFTDAEKPRPTERPLEASVREAVTAWAERVGTEVRICEAVCALERGTSTFGFADVRPLGEGGVRSRVVILDLFEGGGGGSVVWDLDVARDEAGWRVVRQDFVFSGDWMPREAFGPE